MYLAYYSSDYSAKNKLEKAIKDYLRSIDRTVIQDEDFKKFTDSVISEINVICKQNSRCKAKNPHLWTSGVNDKKDVMLSGIDVANFYFYHSDKAYKGSCAVFIDRA